MKHIPTIGIEVRKSPIQGRGAFATQKFYKGRKVGELIGERVSITEARRRALGSRHIRCVEFNIIDRYDGVGAVDCSRVANALAYTNHSCRPNLRLRLQRYHVATQRGTRIRTRVEFFALRDIKPGQELTLDYVTPFLDIGCRCGNRSCRGIIEEG